MAFRYSGKNWQGRSFTTPPALQSMGKQLDAMADRPRSYDGTVASKQHDQVSPNSDHRPTPHTGPGVVRAIDVTVTEAQGPLIVESLRQSQDRRILYVIYDHRVFRSYGTPKWRWVAYSGANPHTHHFHVSFENDYEKDGSPWDLDGANMATWKSEDGFTYIIDDWPPHENGIKWVINEGLMVGKRDTAKKTGDFQASRSIERGEFATVALRLASDAGIKDEIDD